jgi:hypothetical protein
MRQAREGQRVAESGPLGSESSGGMETPLVQRTPAPSVQLNTPATTRAEPGVQVTPEFVHPAREVAPFLPINRYRDPRVLARKVDGTQSPALADLPLNRVEPAGVLPQARSTPPLPFVATRVQRQRAVTATEIDLPQIGSNAPMRVRRRVDEKSERSQPREARRSQSSPHSGIRTSTVQRTPLPLAKLRTGTNGHVVQRDPTTDLDDSFVGSTSTVSSRGKTQTENLGGVDLQTRKAAMKKKEEAAKKSSPASCDEEGSNGKDQDLDRLARAILPVVKRMLAIERDRRDPRLLL